jgi:mono/diheme cytochrome c family protein
MNESSGADHVRQGMDYGENSDVHEVHSAIQREKREPRAGMEPLSIWLIAVYGMAIFFGGAYLGRFSGNFSGDSIDYTLVPQSKTQGPGGPSGPAAELSQADRGKKVFSANCATCHQANGLGVSGQYPPLAGSEYVLGGTKRLGMIVLKGLQGPLTVKGAQYGTAVMQPWDKTLTDAKIADVLTYIRQEWGNKAGPVNAAQISALRKELASHPDSYTEADLKAVPEHDEIPGGESAEAKPADAKNPPPAPPK